MFFTNMFSTQFVSYALPNVVFLELIDGWTLWDSYVSMFGVNYFYIE